jgi:hypothetical protein
MSAYSNAIEDCSRCETIEFNLNQPFDGKVSGTCTPKVVRARMCKSGSRAVPTPQGQYLLDRFPAGNMESTNSKPENAVPRARDTARLTRPQAARCAATAFQDSVDGSGHALNLTAPISGRFVDAACNTTDHAISMSPAKEVEDDPHPGQASPAEGDHISVWSRCGGARRHRP